MCAGKRAGGRCGTSLGPWVFFSLKSQQLIGGLFFYQLAKKGEGVRKETWQEKVAASKSTAASDTKSKLGYTNSTLGI